MKQSTKRLFSSVLALVFIVSAFVLFFDFIQPAYQESLRIRGEEASRRAFVGKQREVIERVKQLVSAYQGNEKIQEVVSLVLPLKPEAAQAIAQLSGMATANGLVPQSFAVSTEAFQNLKGSDPKDANTLIKPIGMLTIQMRLVGAYDDMKKFLKNVETNIRIFDLRTITVQPAGKPNQDLFAYDMAVVTYYQNP